jgi:hypothetical protein
VLVLGAEGGWDTTGCMEVSMKKVHTEPKLHRAAHARQGRAGGRGDGRHRLFPAAPAAGGPQLAACGLRECGVLSSLISSALVDS